ncbi:hypothetical protein YB2330_000671 [Saitoella coloradoensis]
MNARAWDVDQRRFATALSENANLRKQWADMNIDGHDILFELCNSRLRRSLPKKKTKTRKTAEQIEQELKEWSERLQEIIKSFEKLLRRLTDSVDRLHELVIQVSRTKGNAYVFLKPLWRTWTMDRFADAASEVLTCYRQEMDTKRRIAWEVCGDDAKTDKKILTVLCTTWKTEAFIGNSGKEFNEICALEVEEGDPGLEVRRREMEDEMDDFGPTSRRKAVNDMSDW